ncbi:putative membrane protein YvbJ [Bacillus ectoiniformans]|uniref:double zinc ribbon domain-containing protein n=1 Tax=Bacillus ectoiniformans TaxID=1494429 RepID=UPI001956ECF0|nr:zinc ribbon domain-containing protein [Bacillus ectoiniformans]MBM7649906.1 putative membrane protein YvbJ [Bacillus ectoiniformans]
MYCRECGNSVNDRAEVCSSCGVRPLNGQNFCQSCGTETKAAQELCTKCGERLKNLKGAGVGQDQPSGLVNLAACCFPIVGLILYFVWKDEKPKSAKSVCKWAAIGFIATVVLYALSFFLGILSETMYYY